MALASNQWSTLYFKWAFFCNPINKEEILRWLLIETGCTATSSRAPYVIVPYLYESKLLVRIMEPELAMRFKLMGF